jgi:uncharacterized membrane protein
MTELPTQQKKRVFRAVILGQVLLYALAIGAVVFPSAWLVFVVPVALYLVGFAIFMRRIAPTYRPWRRSHDH